LAAELKRCAIVPALNEEASIAEVVEGIRAFDPGFEIVVVADGSVDRTPEVAAAAGATVLRLPFNLGIGGAVQTGFRYAFENGFELAVRLDGDGQHDPQELSAILAPVLADEVDVCVGSRFAGEASFRPTRSRRLGIRILAAAVSLLVRRRVTDPTSGFQALNRTGIRLFAADYPHDYPEVEAAVMAHKHRLRLAEAPVRMRERTAGRSSIRGFRTVYYMAKVMLAIVIGSLRRKATPLEDA